MAHGLIAFSLGGGLPGAACLGYDVFCPAHKSQGLSGSEFCH